MTSVAVTVFGCAGTRPGRGQVCSSYLVEADGYRLLLDCGNGSLANLQQRIDVADVDAVVVSHLHPDHFVDLYGLYYALRFHSDGPRAVPVYAPSGTRDFVARLLHSEDTFAEVCAFSEVAAGDRLALGPLEVELFAANHPIETLASRVVADDTVVAFSADSAPTPALADCARDAELFLCDASWLDREGPYPAGVHMTGAQAGRQAVDAGAQRLVVTHVYPTLDPVEVAAEAARAYDGEIMIARDLQEHVL